MEPAFTIDGPPPGHVGRWTHPSVAGILAQAAKEPPLPEPSELLSVPRERALAALRILPGLLSNGSDEARDNKELAMAAVTANALVFRDLSERLRDDEEVVMAAATGWQWDESPRPVLALAYASRRLRRDMTFLNRLLRARPEEYAALDDDLKTDPAILARVFEPPVSAYWMLSLAPDSVRADPKWVALAIDANPWALHDAKGVVLDDYEVGMRAVKKEGRVLQYLSPRLRDDDAIVRAAIEEGRGLPLHASERLRDDESFIVSALVRASGLAHNTGWSIDEVERRIMQTVASPRVKAKLEAEGRAPIFPDAVSAAAVSDEDIPF